MGEKSLKINGLTEYSVGTDRERGHIFDASDPKWAHPNAADEWGVAIPLANLIDPRVPMEVRAEQAKKAADEMAMMLNGMGAGVDPVCDIKKYVVPGCPEEPEAEVEVLVYRPKGLKKKKARCLFYGLGGGLIMREPAGFPIEQLCEIHSCVAVVPLYRRSWEAQYPAAINDLHAAYKWMIENAEMLQIHPDNVVLNGASSGAHLVTALAFRLKRYGYSPKGVVAIVPQTDDRGNNLLSDKLYVAGWNAELQKQALSMWLGYNFASSHIGPEALANHATVEECIGYPPLFIHTVEFDSDRDNCRAFYGKVLEAKSYAEFHCWGGHSHGMPAFAGETFGGDENSYSALVNAIVRKNIDDCFTYDLRRPWVVEEYNNK